jgi:hypothetical protein
MDHVLSRTPDLGWFGIVKLRVLIMVFAEYPLPFLKLYPMITDLLTALPIIIYGQESEVVTCIPPPPPLPAAAAALLFPETSDEAADPQTFSRRSSGFVHQLTIAIFGKYPSWSLEEEYKGIVEFDYSYLHRPGPTS